MKGARPLPLLRKIDRAMNSRLLAQLLLVATLWFFGPLLSVAYAEDGESTNESHAVLAPFVEKEEVLGEAVAISDEQKHLILFYMGVALLFLVLTTAVIGLQMGMFGKQLFVQHMICAGFTVFLSLAHAVTAIVWFFPF